MRNSRLSLGHVIMILSGLLAFLLTLTLIRGRDQTFRVAVASRNIAAGTTVGPDSFRFVDTAIDGGTLRRFVQPGDVQRVTGWVAGASIPAGDPVTLSEIRPPAAPGGQLAMSIPVPPGLAVGGVLNVGDRVDVISVSEGTSTYLVRGALILAVHSTDSGLVGNTGDFSVTVAIDPETALAVAAAIGQGDGHVQLVRSTGAPAVAVTPSLAPSPTPSPGGG